VIRNESSARECQTFVNEVAVGRIIADRPPATSPPRVLSAWFRQQSKFFSAQPLLFWQITAGLPLSGDDSEARLTREGRPFLLSAGATHHLTPLARAPSFLLA
jgi:hypothetical protein